jgi:hypothetical protein
MPSLQEEPPLRFDDPPDLDDLVRAEAADVGDQTGSSQNFA